MYLRTTKFFPHQLVQKVKKVIPKKTTFEKLKFMKKSFSTSILRVFAVLSLVSCMSTIRLIDKPSDVIKNSENNENKNANYVKANEWMVQAFNNAESVIQFTDKESGVIKGRYAMKMGVTSTSPYVSNTPAFTAIITIRVKDKASRIEIAPPFRNVFSANDGN